MRFILCLTFLFFNLNLSFASEDLNKGLLEAAKEGDVKKVRFFIQALIKNGAEVNVRNSMNQTLLHVASMQGRLEIVEILIESGAEVNVKGVMNQTPLHVASMQGRLEIAEALIKNGANIDALDSRSLTPVDYSRHYNATLKPDDFRHILERVKKFFNESLLKASKDGDLKKVKLFTQRGADVNTRDKGGNTPLHLAENKEVRAFLENHPKVDRMITNNEGRAAHLGIRSFKEEVSKVSEVKKRSKRPLIPMRVQKAVGKR